MHPLNWIDFGEGVSGSIIRYQSEHMRVLKERGARFIDFPEYLDEYYYSLEQNEIGIEQLQNDWPNCRLLL